MRAAIRTALFTVLLLCLTAAACALTQYRTLREGDAGVDVTALKKAMYYLGFIKTLDVNDQYSPYMVGKVKELQAACGLPATGEADEALQALVFSGKAEAAPGAPAPTPVPTASPAPRGPSIAPTLPPLTENGLLLPDGGVDEYVYIDEADGLWIYKSPSLSVEIKRFSQEHVPLVWFESEVVCSPASPLKALLTPGNTPGRRYQDPADMAKDARAVLAISDDFYGYRLNADWSAGVVIRGGSVLSTATYRQNRKALPNLEVLAVYGDGGMKTFLSNAHTAGEYLAMGVTDTFAFGPVLVSEGRLGAHMFASNYYDYPEPRCAIGMIAPYHYLILTVKGRVDESEGATFPWLAEKMLEKGCTEALNLDGGGTTALAFMGRLLNQSGKNARSVTSMIGFGAYKSILTEQTWQ